MKIIIAGATGFLGTQLVRQALSHPAITTVIALGRREMPKLLDLKPTADLAKLKSVVLKDFENYTDAEKAELAGTDAVIW
jgi:nucleoside-diphosphate-sugar epimerase